MGEDKHILMIANTSWCLYNFRYGLIRTLLGQGHAVTVLAPPDRTVEPLQKLGCRTIPLALAGATKNPIQDLSLLRRYRKAFRQIRPDVIFSYTIKSNIYGSIAAAREKIPVIVNITGLGNIFSSQGLTTRLVERLYKKALKRVPRVFFQNDDDQALFLRRKIVQQSQCGRLPGSGVDLKRFQPADGRPDGPLTFLFVGRMLWDKGVGDFAEAAEKVRAALPQTPLRFQLLGSLNSDNPQAIPEEQIRQWESQGTVEYLGTVQDVRPVMAAADCLVLPSRYREGVPRTLIEGAAMALPLIASDNVGCRDIVDEGYNGYLVPPGDSNALAYRMERLIRQTPAERQQMGRAGRQKAEAEFDVALVIQKYLEELERL